MEWILATGYISNTVTESVLEIEFESCVKLPKFNPILATFVFGIKRFALLSMVHFLCFEKECPIVRGKQFKMMET